MVVCRLGPQCEFLARFRCMFEHPADDIPNLSIKVLAQRQLATERKLQHLQYRLRHHAVERQRIDSSRQGLRGPSQRPDQAQFSVSNPTSSPSRINLPHPPHLPPKVNLVNC